MSDEDNDIKQAMATLKVALGNIDGRENKITAITELITILEIHDSEEMQEEFNAGITCAFAKSKLSCGP